MKIGFIGLGNMAKAMIGGMLEKKIAQPEEILGSARTQATLDAVSEEYGILVSASNREVAAWAEILVLAVKPQMLAEVVCEITDSIRQETLLLSVAAGKTIAWIEEAFGGNYKVVRCMPNTPAMVGAGCSGVCRNERVSEEEMELCMALAGSFGMAREIPEKLIDAVGAVSGSSPAFVFMFIEALADSAVKAGMARKDAYHFAAQAVFGSAKLMLESGKHPGELKDMVCSPGGTTIEGVQALEEMGFRASVMKAIEACVDKTRKL